MAMLPNFISQTLAIPSEFKPSNKLYPRAPKIQMMQKLSYPGEISGALTVL
jgi:hypothetical protein